MSTMASARVRIQRFQRRLARWFVAAALGLTVIDGSADFCGFPAEAGGVCEWRGRGPEKPGPRSCRRVARLGDDIGARTIYFSDRTSVCSVRRLCASSDFACSIPKTYSDDRFRLPLAALHDAIRRGRRHVFVHFAIRRRMPGATNTGAIDRLARLSELCAEENLWPMQRRVRQRLRVLRTWPGKIGRAGSG